MKWNVFSSVVELNFIENRDARELITAIIFLVEEGSYRYVLSGSILGVELKDIRSIPVGYMEIMDMYPLDFEEFCLANKVSDVVNTYVETNNLREVMDIQNGINQLYKRDIAKYDPKNKLYLEDIFELIPSELNSKNKRFILKNLNENFEFSRYEHSFI